MSGPTRFRGDTVDERGWADVPSAFGKDQGQSKGDKQVVIQLLPWWYQPLPQSQDFLTILKTAALGAGPATTIKPAGLLTQLQAGYLAVIKFITIFIDAPTATLDVDWIFLINDAPIPGWTMSSFPRAATNLTLTFDATIRPPEGATVSMAIRNNEATPRVVGASYGGWQTPRGLVDSTYGPNNQ